mmetsp:Transcript_463/g.1079  ORF Transcript_463/g.1079 Transcript_463/m.1079 type:complete len:292 (-) Transcript_463:802-1677(-)
MMFPHDAFHLCPRPPATEVSDHRSSINRVGCPPHGTSCRGLISFGELLQLDVAFLQHRVQVFLTSRVLQIGFPSLQGDSQEATVRGSSDHGNDALCRLHPGHVHGLDATLEAVLLLGHLSFNLDVFHDIDPALEHKLLQASVRRRCEAGHDTGSVLFLGGLGLLQLLLKSLDLRTTFPDKLLLLCDSPPNLVDIFHELCLLFFPLLQNHVVAVVDLALLELGEVTFQDALAIAILSIDAAFHGLQLRSRCPAIEDQSTHGLVISLREAHDHLGSSRIREAGVLVQLGLCSC